MTKAQSYALATAHIVKPPYGKTFTVLKDLVDIQSRNYSPPVHGTIPAGLKMSLMYEDGPTSTSCMLEHRDEFGDSIGVPLSNGQQGYMFCIPNKLVSEAFGIPMPEETEDIVGAIMAYEGGTASRSTTKKLFRSLKQTGLGAKLQGHYSSKMEWTQLKLKRRS